ncbi:MBL fold metallo-hydrolase [Streptomyces fuscichromogenes]|uniref:MBL fold metallo-hydrolase n=1 Tax=Streptomyces fuscichromogenes TaxID=1324013 RepID=UPI0037F7C2CC
MTELAEQPQDWTEPGAHPVVPGVHRIPLPLPLDDLHTVNVYVVDDPAGPVVVDSGWAGPETARRLEAGLGGLGYTLGDISQFVVTHAHWDHYTHALALRDTYGTPVRLGRGERTSIEDFDLSAGAYPGQVVALRRCGAPGLAAEIAALVPQPHETGMPFGHPDEWLDHGDLLGLKQRDVEVFATPGHTRGHIVLRDAEAGLLFSGDHVLPYITPSLGLERTPEPRPLRSFLDSLRMVRDLPDTLLLPAHGPVTHSVHLRVDELIEHHRERLDETAASVRAGAETAHEVARTLPWTRRRRSLDDLSPVHAMMAVLEIAEHLELLADAGGVTACDADGVRRYSFR